MQFLEDDNKALLALEKLFLKLKQQPHSLQQTFDQLVQDHITSAEKSATQDLRDAAAQIIQVMEEDHLKKIAHQTLPNYHNIEHTHEVLIALGILLSEEKKLRAPAWKVFSGRETCLLLVATLSHDFLHPGGVNRTAREFELLAVNAASTILKAYKLSSKELSWFRELILATDFEHVKTLHQHYQKNSSTPSTLTQAQILLTEADILASVLPHHGVQLATRLVAEFKKVGVPNAAAMATPAGRQRFLEKVSFSSPHAQSLGLIL